MVICAPICHRNLAGDKTIMAYDPRTEARALSLATFPPHRNIFGR
jgi:hypothetical protein